MRFRMTLRFLAAALLAACSTPLLGQAAAPLTPGDLTGPPVATADTVPVAIDTSLGRIVIAVDRLHAPVTSANFLHYVDTHRLDGETIYRSMHTGGGGLIQGGVRSDTRKLFPPIPDETTAKTGLKNAAGAISMARLEPGSGRADFFILLSDMPGFDAGANPADPDGYAVFGRVVEGMDVVQKIFEAPTDPNKGEGVMKGQFLDPPVKILRAARLQGRK
jgi:peptidyl-prolyl cis-trans isomerase A (cyclophilin A)